MSEDRAAEHVVRVTGARCPYCHEDVPRGDEPAVCPDCHALHHIACMVEHGRCAACQAVHPRFGHRLGSPRDGAHERDPDERWRGGRRFTAGLLTSVALVAAIATVVDDGPDAVLGWVTAGAALLGVWPARRSAILGEAISMSALGLGYLAVIALSSYERQNNGEALLGWGLSLTILGAAQLLLRRARRAGPAAPAEKAPVEE